MSSIKGSRMHSDDKNPAKRYTEESLTNMFDRIGVEDPSPDMDDIPLKLIVQMKKSTYFCEFRNEDESSSSSMIKNTHTLRILYTGNDSQFLDIQVKKKDFDREFRIPKNFSGDDEALDQLQRKIKENWLKAFQAIFKCMDKVMGFPRQKAMHLKGQTSEHSNKAKGKDKKNSKGPKKENRNEAESGGSEKRPENNMNRERQEKTTKGMNYPTSAAGNSYYFSGIPAYLYPNGASYYAGTVGLYMNNGQQWMNPSGGANATERTTRGIARRGRNVPTHRRVCNCSCHDMPSPAGQEGIDYMKTLNISGKELKPTGSKKNQ
ncbi:hypothetical protein TNCT_199791 [Trichonephila clavata]|uniref:Uncharacterized protein n=1 Tax=Trichonephila clavata TaxID=2740835 RepID=A0A8X6JCB6_TRICU|nr:hypothetical protein TNCT_199791 [Trichonephila clavata]